MWLGKTRSLLDPHRKKKTFFVSSLWRTVYHYGARDLQFELVFIHHRFFPLLYGACDLEKFIRYSTSTGKPKNFPSFFEGVNKHIYIWKIFIGGCLTRNFRYNNSQLRQPQWMIFSVDQLYKNIEHTNNLGNIR